MRTIQGIPFPAATVTDTGIVFPRRLTAREMEKAVGISDPFRVHVQARWGQTWHSVVVISAIEDHKMRPALSVELVSRLPCTLDAVGRKYVWRFQCNPPAEMRTIVNDSRAS